MATCRECIHFHLCQNETLSSFHYYKSKSVTVEELCSYFKSDYVKRERGEWVKQQFVQPLFDFNGAEYAQVSARCTNCGRDTYDVVDSEGKEKFDYINYKICPHCGADMRKER